MKNNPMRRKSNFVKGPTTPTLNTKSSSPKFSRQYLGEPTRTFTPSPTRHVVATVNDTWEFTPESYRPSYKEPKKLPRNAQPLIWKALIDDILLRHFIAENVTIVLMDGGVQWPDAMVRLTEYVWVWSLPHLTHQQRSPRAYTLPTSTLYMHRRKADVGRYYKGLLDTQGTPFKIGRLNGPKLDPEVPDARP